MNRLPLGLRARHHEPGHGVLLRLGARNGFKSARRFARSLEIDFRKVLTGADASYLAAMAGLDPMLVRGSSPTVILPDRKVSLCKQELELNDWSTRCRRYCVACLSLDLEEALRLELQPAWYLSHRTIWDVRLVSACPQHLIQLINLCHHCGRTLGWHTTDVMRCAHCKANLLSAPCIAKVDPVGDYVARRLNEEEGHNAVLDRLPLSSAMRLCERLGQIEAVGAVHSLPRQSTEMLFLARARGFQMTQDLEKSVLAALDAIVWQDKKMSGLIGTYGWIYGEWLCNADESYAQVRRILFDHAVRNGVISRDEPRLGNNPRDTVTMTQTARQLGMGYKRARALAAEAGIVPAGSRRSVSFTMDPQAVEALHSIAQTSAIIRDVARVLGTGKMQVADLLGAGFLLRAEYGAVSSASVSRLLDVLKSQSCAGSPPENLLGMTTAARNASVPLWRIVSAAHAGTIPFWCGAGIGLQQFMVRLCDVKALRPASSLLSVEAAAKRIGVHHDCARAMVRCGTLADKHGKVTANTVASFERKFVVGSKIARALGCSPRALHQELLGVGIQPIFDLRTHRQVVYLRKDIARAGLTS